MDVTEIIAPVSDDMAAVNRLIGKRLQSDVALINQLAGYIVKSGGKRLRPLLVLLSARACGYRHVGWAPAGFLGDELPSDVASNEQLLKKALRDIRPGDILLAHLGIWSRKDPWAPEVLEPLVIGLKAKGFCFATLRDHPAYREWIARSK